MIDHISIQVRDPAISAAAGDRDVLIRAHKLRGPMLAVRDELTPGQTDLAAAEHSFAAIVDLAPPEHPDYGRHQANLADVRTLLQRH